MMMLLGVACFSGIPFAVGGISISWDALNHHFYLGWAADEARFSQDLLAASFQSYQYPYLYWPAFKLAEAGLSGAQAGAVLASLLTLAIPPVWLMVRMAVPGRNWYSSLMRLFGTILAFQSALVVSLLDTTANDLTAAIPLVWAIAMALEVFDPVAPAWLTRLRAVLMSGAFAGIAVAFKLSNGPMAIVLPILWWLSPGGIADKLRSIFAGCTATLLFFAVFYGWWGWQLWTHFGNPIYPFLDARFEVLRALSGWRAP